MGREPQLTAEELESELRECLACYGRSAELHRRRPAGRWRALDGVLEERKSDGRRGEQRVHPSPP